MKAERDDRLAGATDRSWLGDVLLLTGLVGFLFLSFGSERIRP